jgi:hypothetical protein
MYFKGVKVYNAGSPWRYAKGGKIHKFGDMTEKQIKNDSIHIVAMPNELIIPVNHPKFPKSGELVNKVINYLDKLDVVLPNTRRSN